MTPAHGSATQITLGYGTTPLPLPPGLTAEVLESPRPTPVPDLERALREALARPIGSARLEDLASPQTRALVIVSDSSRDEPRAQLYAAVREALAVVPDDRITLAIANGTHGTCPVDSLGLPREVLRRHRIVNHDALDEREMVDIGRTRRGTRVRVNRCLLANDLVVSTGRVKPHYFAGYGGGAKGIFPGLGHNDDVRQNHKLKADPASSLGRADGNPCREDLEEAVRLIDRPAFLLNVAEAGGVVIGAVAGDLVAAHRKAVESLRPLCEVRSRRADIVVVSAPLPVSGSLYQASKLVPPAGILLHDGGVVIVAAECPEGTGPLQTVNEAIFELGVRRFLPPHYTLFLVSGMTRAIVDRTYARYAPSLEAALDEARRISPGEPRILVLPDAGDLVPIPAE